MRVITSQLALSTAVGNTVIVTKTMPTKPTVDTKTGFVIKAENGTNGQRSTEDIIMQQQPDPVPAVSRKTHVK